jgi:hypothetical protein
MDVRVAYSIVADSNVHLVGTQLRQFIVIALKRFVRSYCCVSIVLGHVCGAAGTLSCVCLIPEGD